MDNKIKIECPSCSSAGVYQGFNEEDGTAVICTDCKGVGFIHFEYNDFTGIKHKDGVDRVYVYAYGRVLRPGVSKFKVDNNNINVDLDNEGVTYDEFLNGKTPKHIESLGCPMTADQGTCHSIEGFIGGCGKLNDGYISNIKKCKHQCKKHECWDRFYDR